MWKPLQNHHLLTLVDREGGSGVVGVVAATKEKHLSYYYSKYFKKARNWN